jgi:hypothetical protein
LTLGQKDLSHHTTRTSSTIGLYTRNINFEDFAVFGYYIKLGFVVAFVGGLAHGYNFLT